MKNILLICSLLTGSFALGQKIGIFIESGSTINQPLKKQMGTPIDWSNPQPGNYSRAYTAYGYYFKAGVDLGIVRKKNWTFGMPVGISYMQMNRKDYTESIIDESRYDIESFCLGHQQGYIYNRTNSIAGFFGPQFKISCKHMSFYSNILLNGMRAISNRDYALDSESGKKLLNYINRFPNPIRNAFVASYGLGVQYKMKACTLGINSDLYFMRPFSTGAYNSPMPFMGNRIWINPGIRFQYNLK
jgi:hypothetical protein